jgi:hypothetical protein
MEMGNERRVIRLTEIQWNFTKQSYEVRAVMREHCTINSDGTVQLDRLLSEVIHEAPTYDACRDWEHENCDAILYALRR